VVQTSVTATISRVLKDNVYKTLYTPILTGSKGSLFNLYIYDAGDPNNPSRLDQNDYNINPDTGTIQIFATTTLGSGQEYRADYSYVNTPYTKQVDSFSESSFDQLRTGAQFITRNMTDYISGKVPVLREFQPDKTRSDYYPVVEYYVTPDGQIVFSRDFFKYGDSPAVVEVEYESLDIKPRLAVFALRTSSTRTPRVKGVSMGFRSAAAALERDV
jgi:hypothetical protein